MQVTIVNCQEEFGIHEDSGTNINHCMLMHVSEKSQGHTADSITFQHFFIFRLTVSF